MHEIGVVTRIYNEILASGKTRRAIVVLGALKSVDEKSFKTLFAEMAKCGALEGMQVEVRIVSLKIHCHHCGFEGVVEDIPHMHSTFLEWPCPECGQGAEILSGNEEEVEELE